MNSGIKFRRYRYLFLLWLVCIINNAQGQVNKDKYCEFLKKIVQSDDFQTAFPFCHDTNVVLIDTAKNFVTCDSETIDGRTLQLANVRPSYINLNMLGRDVLKARDRNYDAILCLVREKHGKTDVYLYWPVQNSVLELLLTVVKGSVVMENIYQGELYK